MFPVRSRPPSRLRALSSGGSVTSPPPSPAMPKYKLAEYRYGREEMLALYIKDNKVRSENRHYKPKRALHPFRLAFWKSLTLSSLKSDFDLPQLFF